MSRILLITLSSAVILLSSGCSSSNDPKEIALDLCEYSKKMDIASIKSYAAQPLQEQLTQLEKMIEVAKSGEDGAKIYKEHIERFANVQCKETTKVVANDDGTYKVSNTSTQQFYTLKNVEGSWKMFK